MAPSSPLNFVNFFVVFTAWLFLPMHAFAATYYVDAANGSDAGLGTSAAAAWKSVSKVNSRALAAGDVVLFRRNDSFDGVLEFASGEAGTAQNPITVSAYGTGSLPILEAIDMRSGSNFVVIENIIVDHRKMTGDTVRIRGAKNVTLRNMEVRNGLNELMGG